MTARRLFRAAGWLCIMVIAVLSLVTPSLRPVTFMPHNLEHAAIFAAAGSRSARLSRVDRASYAHDSHPGRRD